MAWKIHDEWIDLSQAHHYVIFKNHDTGAEHHVIHEFKLDACPHCGHPKVKEDGAAIDFHQVKADTLAALTAHHTTVMQYREKHRTVRIGAGPKP